MATGTITTLPKPDEVNGFAVLEDQGHAAHISKTNHHFDLPTDYSTNPDVDNKMKMDIAIAIAEALSEGNEMVKAFSTLTQEEINAGAKTQQWTKEDDNPSNLYCMNNAEKFVNGWMTGSFVQDYVTNGDNEQGDDLLSIILNSEEAMDALCNWYENKIIDIVNQYNTTGITYTDDGGNTVTATCPKGVTVSAAKAITDPKAPKKGQPFVKFKVGSHWRKMKFTIKLPSVISE